MLRRRFSAVTSSLLRVSVALAAHLRTHVVIVSTRLQRSCGCGVIQGLTDPFSVCRDKGMRCYLIRPLGEIPMHTRDDNGAFTDGGGDALHRINAYVSDSVDFRNVPGIRVLSKEPLVPVKTKHFSPGLAFRQDALGFVEQNSGYRTWPGASRFWGRTSTSSLRLLCVNQ